MNQNIIFIPVLVQIIITLAVFIALSIAKANALKHGEVDESRRALYDDAWPEGVQKINNNIRNQFETPVLFYLLTIILWLLDAANPLAQLLAWLYVLTRFLHTWIHTRSNYVPMRRRLFMLSMFLLFLLTLLAVFAVFNTTISGEIAIE